MYIPLPSSFLSIALCKTYTNRNEMCTFKNTDYLHTIKHIHHTTCMTIQTMDWKRSQLFKVCGKFFSKYVYNFYYWDAIFGVKNKKVAFIYTPQTPISVVTTILALFQNTMFQLWCDFYCDVWRVQAVKSEHLKY